MTTKLPTIDEILLIRRMYARCERDCRCSICSLIAAVEARNGLLVRTLAGHPPSPEEIRSVIYPPPSSGPTTLTTTTRATDS